ncbi:MAG: Plasmid-derived single-stranded DNA-binding protein [Chlamydiae bacterium]|nr:Plasmid-derived single-stranded DNA-binding protein [Chlamydiota bacterium]
MNQTTIMGHLGSDPEVRFTSSGQKVTNLRVAANQRRGGKEETFWWRVTIWGEQFDKIIPYFKKGSAIIVNGEMLMPEIFTNRDGKPQISLNLVAYNISFPPFGRKEEGSQKSYEPSEQTMQKGQGEQQQQQQQQGQQQQETPAFTEDEIPF